MTRARRSTGASATSLPIAAVLCLARRCTPPTFRTDTARPTCWRRSAISSRGCLFPWLRHVFADGAYAGEKLETALAGRGQWTLEIVKRSDQAKGFQLLPRRWVVERPFGWFGRNRRLARDFERTIASSEAWLFLASVQLLARRLARP